MDHFLRKFVARVLRHRIACLVCIIFGSLLSAYILRNAVIASSIEAMFFGADHIPFQNYKVRVKQFGDDSVLLAGITTPSTPLDKAVLLSLIHI